MLCRIIETGSLRAAAEEIRTDPSNVTRRLSGLEDRLGVWLINRSRVRSTATDAGQRYYSELKTLLKQLEALEDDVAGVAGEPRGLLRVAGPSVFGARHIGPWLHELQALYPRLEIDLVLTDRTVDLVEQSIDIAVRIGRLEDSSLIGVRLGTMLTVVVAAPAYLSRYGTARTPEDLRRHHLVLHAGRLQTAKLTLTGPQGRTVTIPCRSRFTVSSILGVQEAVMAGAGLNAGPLAVRRGHRARRVDTRFAGLEPAEVSGSRTHGTGAISTREIQQRTRHAACKGFEAAGDHWLSMTRLYLRRRTSVAAKITRVALTGRRNLMVPVQPPDLVPSLGPPKCPRSFCRTALPW